MASTESSILSAVRSTIAGLGLTTEEVVIRKKPWDMGNREHWYPGITVHRGREVEFTGLNTAEDIGYAAIVTMVVDNSGDPTEDDLFANFRQQIRQAFIHQRLSGVTSVTTCLVQPGPVYEKVPENYDVSSFTVLCINREVRT